MRQVFVSYPSESSEAAHKIMEYIEACGIKCFIAPRDIKGGKPYASELVSAQEECDVVLLVASHHINASEHVANEVDVIVSMNKPILPVFIEDFTLSGELRYYLGRKQWVAAYPDKLEAYLGEILQAVKDNLPKSVIAEKPEVAAVAEDAISRTTVFEYNSERGVMINPEDHERNVSFRTDTFVNMMGGIFAKVKDLVGEEEAESIFFDSGYSSGRNFAERNDSRWDMGFTKEGLQAKFDKWCQFDSAVGWGKFSAIVNYDEANDTISGTICINEAFIVDSKNKRKICAFIKGYCTGVTEVLLKSDVELVCRSCPMQSRLGTKCVFEFELK